MLDVKALAQFMEENGMADNEVIQLTFKTGTGEVVTIVNKQEPILIKEFA